MKHNSIYKGLKQHFSSKITKDRQFMVQLTCQGGIEEHMLEYLHEYLNVKTGEFTKQERDLVSVVLKKVV